jgi:DNA/RNA-binding domain of Phe-tRNA-synthetase-like protein
MELRLSGDEQFTPLDSEQVENPVPGEVIFAEGKTVLTRRWTWRQGRHTLVVPTTTAVEFNVDGLPPVPISEVESACQDIAELIEQFCGGNTRYEIVTKVNPKVKL